MQSWGLQPAELGFLLQPLRQAWQAVGTSWRLEWFRLRVVQGPWHGGTICFSLLSTDPLSGPHPLLQGPGGTMREHDPWALVSRPGPLLLYDTRRIPSWGGSGGGKIVEGGSVRHHRHPALSHHYLLGNCSCHFVTVFFFFCLLGDFFSSGPPRE